VKESKPILYKVKYLVPSDDLAPDLCLYNHPLQRGDIVRLSDGDYYCVIALIHTCGQYDATSENSPIILVSGPSQTYEDAMLSAIDYKHLPKSFWPFLSEPDK
jgi:hypothetical protein